MTNSSQEPKRLGFASGGFAPIISYDVPEPITYEGRNFIELQIPDSYFIKSNSVSQKLAAQTTSLTNEISPEEALEIAQAQIDEQLINATSPLSSELKQLDINEVAKMVQAGKKLNIYSSMYGTLTYNYVDAQPSSDRIYSDDFINNIGLNKTLSSADSADISGLSTFQDGPIADLKPIDDDPIELDPPSVSITINTPANNANISGPHTGAIVTISGKVSTFKTQVKDVRVRVGSGQFQTASRNLSNWSFSTTITSAGTVPITALVTPTIGEEDQKTINLNVSLAAPPETTPPIIAITSPSNGATLTHSNLPGTFPVTITGTATDASGVQSVEISVNNSPYSPATPKAAGDWSTWSRQLSLPIGTHSVKARCTDNKGNPAQVTTNFNIVSSDKTPPTVNITSPSNNGVILGSFNGATITVTGTASDPSGIQKVELILNNSPVSVIAQPKAPGDWSTWTGSLNVTEPGLKIITAKCTDNAGNSSISAAVQIQVNLIPDIVSNLNRIILVESYRLSSYLGNYGAGRTIKTFSLLPGEKTKISIKTYTRTEEEAKQASNILDSFTEESAKDFEQSMGNEQSNRKNYDESFKYNVNAEAKASWGWGSASVSGGVSGGSNSAREDFAKNISNATQKHVAKASALRKVQVDTSYEVKSQTGEETAIEREIENINVSRTLNFVFRQMNQEFITLLHLVDVRIGFFKQDKTYQEVTFPQLDSLLAQAILPERRTEVRNWIINQTVNIFDYQDKHHRFVEEKLFTDADGIPISGSSYLRVKKDYASVYKDPATDTEIRVPGIILAANKHVLRTEGIIVEALLGQGNGLDDYSHGLQETSVATKQLNNQLMQTEIDKQRLAMSIVESRDAEAAGLFAQVYQPRIAESVKHEETNGKQAPV